MNSEDKANSLITLFVVTGLAILVLLVGQCTMHEDALREPREVISVKAEHFQKMKCIEMRGNWTHEDGIDKCQFK